MEKIVSWLLFWSPTSLQPLPASSPWKGQSRSLLEPEPTAQSGLTDSRTPKRREPPQRAKRCSQRTKELVGGEQAPLVLFHFCCSVLGLRTPRRVLTQLAHLDFLCSQADNAPHGGSGSANILPPQHTHSLFF